MVYCLRRTTTMMACSILTLECAHAFALAPPSVYACPSATIARSSQAMPKGLVYQPTFGRRLKRQGHGLRVYMSLGDALFQPQFEALNAASSYWLRACVWMDFRLAVAFFVATPLLLLAASVFDSNDTARRLMFGYWQASSLLLITVLLNIGEVPVSSFTGFLANFTIASSLLWWKDLNEEIFAQNSLVAGLYRLWRPLALTTAAASAALQAPFLHCASYTAPSSLTPSLGPLSSSSHPMLADAVCAASLEPPVGLYELMRPLLPLSPLQISTIGILGLVFYAAYLTYYILLPLRAAGRLGRLERESWTVIDPLIALGWITPQNPPDQGRSVVVSFLPVALALTATAACLFNL